MKTKLIHTSSDSDTYKIVFGNEIFNADFNKTYPRIAEWNLSRYSKESSTSLFSMYFPCGRKTKFKSLSDIKKFIRDRKYL
ncbi:hypothetical protein [uncultured Mediterranean phage uvMED]|nr:hypothetical protein [uncultured Mediterranean phage uvMED]BAR20101.1 hypothetical protein [uncultured Mediterranean phage uvMED]BAR20163.1 hypothetical protein [uncultured Mediterranean phage uvMED]BAR20232.1 hypothetical protein [uncultured Mediterranean phage uvMED]BAR38381.1 hypothetical protein [uncultured Mediterranean phage uvMED]